jgi:photosystem II stability/assembly factor-like uncharacterized protein
VIKVSNRCRLTMLGTGEFFQMRKIPCTVGLLIALCLLASGQNSTAIQSMKLFDPDAGWAATNKNLFWTTDGGAQWKDITPKANGRRVVASVFFLDTSNGWALLAYAGKEDSKTGISETLFELASTQDSGET